MWKPADVQHEVTSVCLLLQARPNAKDMAEGLGSQLLHKLNGLAIVSPSELVQLYDVVKGSALPQELKDTLVAALDKKALGVNDNQSSTKTTQGQQQCDTLHHYFTEEEHKQLATLSPYQGADVIAGRLKMLGFRSLKESTKGVATGILLWYHESRGGQRYSPDASYDLVGKVHSSFLGCTVGIPTGAPSLVVYPSHPRELSQTHLQAAYPDSPPVDKEMAGLASLIKHHVILRESSKKLLKNRSGAPAIASNAMLPPLSTQQQCGPSFQQLWDTFQQGSQMLLQQHMANMAGQPQLPGLQIFGNQQGKAEATDTSNAAQKQVSNSVAVHSSLAGQPLALCDRSATASAQPESKPQPTEQPALPVKSPSFESQTPQESPTEGNEKPKTLEDFEKQNFETLKSKGNKGMKRPAAAPSSVKKVTAKVKAQPKSSGKPSGSLKLGCRKCRGSVNGCSQCRKPTYNGVRMNRSEWVAFAHKNNLK